MSWINVSNKFPEKDGQYLIINMDAYYPSIKLCTFTKCEYSNMKENSFYHSENTVDGSDFYEDDATHWMELPEFPDALISLCNALGSLDALTSLGEALSSLDVSE
jgi:hypothetical protein